MKSARLFLLVAVLMAAACGDDSPTQPSGSLGSPLQDLYTEELSPGGTTTYAFQSIAPGAARITLINVTDASGAVVTTPLTLVFGVPKDDACAPTATVLATPGLVAHVTSAIDASVYCVSVADPGTLTGPMTFLVRISYPMASVPGGTAGTDTWSSTLTPMGTATRTIIASGAGPVSVQLDSLGGASGPVDFALGMPANDGRGCYLTRSVRTAPGSASALSLQVDPGRYCVRLADTGQLTSNATFSVTITHP